MDGDDWSVSEPVKDDGVGKLGQVSVFNIINKLGGGGRGVRRGWGWGWVLGEGDMGDGVVVVGL